MLGRVGKYALEREIGAGGMGVVYLGRPGPGPGPGAAGPALVAIKTMTQGPFADPRERERFVREAQIALRVRHPNVVASLELVEEGGRSSTSWSTWTGSRSARSPARRATTPGRCPPESR